MNGRGSRIEILSPKVLEPNRAKLGVTGGVRDRDMPKPILDSPGVDAVICELVAAAMSEHVKVHRQRETSTLADDHDEPVDGIGRERRPAHQQALSGDEAARRRP
jgi:hypothetical protein